MSFDISCSPFPKIFLQNVIQLIIQ